MSGLRLGGIVVAASAFTLVCASTPAQGDSQEVVRTFIENSCTDCHGGDEAEAGLDLTKLAWKLEVPDIRQKWIQLHDRIESGEMPPDADALPAQDRQSLLSALSGAIHAADHAEVLANGRGPMRRLNRGEYENNLADLLKLPNLDVRDKLPEDREGYHFNKTTEMLDISRVQLAAYLDAADDALRQAVASGTQARQPIRYHAWATNMFSSANTFGGREAMFFTKKSTLLPLSGADLGRIRKKGNYDKDVELAIFRSASWPYYGYPHGFVCRSAGEYRVRFSARAVRQVRDFRLQPAPTSAPFTFRARAPSGPDVFGDVRSVGGLMDIQPEEAEYQTTVLLAKGETFEYSLLGLPVPFPITSHGGPLYYDFPPMPAGGHPGIAFRWLEIVGPIDSEQWPPASHRMLFGDLPIQNIKNIKDTGLGPAVEVVTDQPAKDASRLFRQFAHQAARRPVPESALEIYEQLIRDQLDAGAPFAEAMLAGYKAFLCSRHFLYLHEPMQTTDHYAIAERLSHFLWNSRPDATLLTHARNGKLRSAAVLREETDRLIAGPLFARFVENFTDYWLNLKELRRDEPDIRLYPEYRLDDYLIESTQRETRAFFTAMVRENLSASVLVDADFAFLNDRLARHYGMPAVIGSGIRKVSLPESSPYGGLITQASVLKVTSNGTTTSPVLRGAWIMDRILGDPPPPPPAKVPAVEPDIRGAKTIRDLLALHTKSESCAGCHARFDPVGLALENFDIMGAWRDRYRSLASGEKITGIDRAGHKYTYYVAQPVQPNGKLLDGKTFAGIHELKTILASQPRKLARNLLHQFTTYATGTPVRFSDRPVIAAILDQCEPAGFRTADLLHGLIASRIFLGESGSQIDSAK